MYREMAEEATPLTCISPHQGASEDGSLGDASPDAGDGLEEDASSWDSEGEGLDTGLEEDSSSVDSDDLDSDEDASSVADTSDAPEDYPEATDTSDEEEVRNTRGNVPLEWYAELSHLGYDIDGTQIAKPLSAERDEVWATLAELKIMVKCPTNLVRFVLLLHFRIASVTLIITLEHMQ